MIERGATDPRLLVLRCDWFLDCLGVLNCSVLVVGMAISDDVLAMTFSENSPSLAIDGMLMDSATIASVLREAKQRTHVKELSLRNVAIDRIVAQAAQDLFSMPKRKWNKIDTIHCTGQVSRWTQTTVSHTQQFSFTGSVPIAHNPRYLLDVSSLRALGHALKCHKQLTTLSLKGTRLPQYGFIAFCAGLAKSTSLQTLQMSHCALESDQVALLSSALEQNQHLISLSLAHCKFGLHQHHPHMRRIIRRRRRAPQDNEDAEDNNNDREDDEDENDSEEEDHEDEGEEVEEEEFEEDIEEEVEVELETTTNITASTNNNGDDEPPEFATMIEALVSHPRLQLLNIYGIYCNPRSTQALSALLRNPNSVLWHLGLKNNVRYPEDTLSLHPIIQALRENTKLTYLQLSGNNVEDEHVQLLAEILTTSNRTLRALSLTNNIIGDDGLLALAQRLPDIQSLRYLDLQRNAFSAEPKRQIIAALKHNIELERLDLDGTWDATKSFYLSLNKGGRRLLPLSHTTPLGLWPLVLERANKLQFGRNQPNANLDVLYCLLLQGPAALYQQPRKRKRIDTENHDRGEEDEKPRAKRRRTTQDEPEKGGG